MAVGDCLERSDCREREGAAAAVTIRGGRGLEGVGCQVLSRWLGVQPLAGKNQVLREFV